MSDELKAPFPWFGGKRRVADLVWNALGPVDNYVEPFAGSLACLWARPDDRWQTGAETVNDADSYLSNFWRALAADPEQVAHYADWPVNETDLLARHLWLVNTGRERIAKMEADPDFYDAKVAGWWVWGINAWIGSGWCSGTGPWKLQDGQVVNSGNAGRGVNRKLPHLGNAGRGVNRQLPRLAGGGNGADLRIPDCIGEGDGLIPYFAALAARLRRVRVCCGDWARVVTNGAMSYGDSVGVFLDPPYLGDVRTKDLYRVDDHKISIAARNWALAADAEDTALAAREHRDKRLRIVLAGYAEEHQDAMPASWRIHEYSANAAYQTANGGGVNAANRHNERLWFSPHCLGCESGGLFA